MSDVFKSTEEKMNKSIVFLKEDLATIRAGRANPAVLDKITVEYYGSETPLNQVANITVPEARSIIIQPWESSMLKEIEKSIQKSDLGLNPANDGKVVRLSFPPLTEERRVVLKKEVEKKGEECRVHIRTIRRDAMEDVKAQKKSGELTEDDLKNAEKEIQNLTDKFINEVGKIIENKAKELMEI